MNKQCDEKDVLVGILVVSILNVCPSLLKIASAVLLHFHCFKNKEKGNLGLE
jgi:hypothetical protein